MIHLISLTARRTHGRVTCSSEQGSERDGTILSFRSSLEPHAVVDVANRPDWASRVRALLREVFSDHVMMVAAGLAFHGALALVPSLAAAAALYAILGGSSAIDARLQGLQGFVPRDVIEFLKDPLTSVASSLGLGLGFATSLALILWTAQRAASGLLTALNIVFDEPERRGFWHRQGVALAVAAGGILVLFVSLAAIAVLPAALSVLGWEGRSAPAFLQWPALAIVLLTALACLFSFAPSRQHATFRWVSWGTLAATALWLLASVCFSAYLRHLGSFGRLYGSMGAVVILLLWLYIGALSVLIGAEIDALSEAGKGRPERSPLKSELAKRERRDDREGDTSEAEALKGSDRR